MAKWVDESGRPLQVGARVVSTGVDDGQPLWAHWGTVRGFGRARVAVQWDGFDYDGRDWHRCHPTGLRRVDVTDSPALATDSSPRMVSTDSALPDDRRESPMNDAARITLDACVVETEEGATYTPWTNGWAIGFRVSAPGQPDRVVCLNPSQSDTLGESNVFLYLDDATDDDLPGAPVCYVGIWDGSSSRPGPGLDS